jgi:hypothetical protein
MTDEVKSLWGELPEIKKLMPPHEIIKAQNRFLQKMTGNLVSLSVEKIHSKSVICRYDIYLVVDSVSYRELIFSLTHDHKLYPANIYNEQESQEYKAESQEEFEKNLGKILSTKEIMETIAMLIAQHRLESEYADEP